jgi:hypothetical protein
MVRTKKTDIGRLSSKNSERPINSKSKKSSDLQKNYLTELLNVAHREAFEIFTGNYKDVQQGFKETDRIIQEDQKLAKKTLLDYKLKLEQLQTFELELSMAGKKEDRLVDTHKNLEKKLNSCLSNSLEGMKQAVLNAERNVDKHLA